MSFKIASKFKDAAVVMNRIPVDKFPRLLSKLIQKLHLKNTRLFSEEEEMQLKEVFQLSGEELALVLDGCCYMFEQAAFSSTGPEQLYELLLETGFTDLHAKSIGKTWLNEAPAYISKLKARTLGVPALDSSNYRLNLLMGTSGLTKLQEPTALFEFNVVTPAVAIDQAERSEKVNMEFSHGELYDFLVQLDRVQEQLDGISS
jgi:hypothetical protein